MMTIEIPLSKQANAYSGSSPMTVYRANNPDVGRLERVMSDKQNKVYAEDVNYFDTGRSSPDTIIEKAKKEIRGIGGSIKGEMFGQDETGKSAYVLMFSIGDDNYKIEYPVLESRAGKTLSARRQAATALYHDVKSKCVTMKFVGARGAFMPYLLLPNGQTTSRASVDNLMLMLPSMLLLESK